MPLMSRKRKYEEDSPISFSRSNFKYYYAKSTVPRSLETLMTAVDDFVESYCLLQDGCSLAKCSFDQSIKSSSVSEYNKSIAMNEGQSTAMNRAAQKLWTSNEESSCTSGKKKFYSMVNEALRSDHRDLMIPLAVITRAINQVCLFKTDAFPEEGVCWRGGGIMASTRDFFVRNRHYRVPGFLATSFSIQIAKKFMMGAAKRGEEPILWTVRLDERGETERKYRCLHVNLLNAHEYGEQEFLFVPYSTFTVQFVQWSPRPTIEMPHRITIVAALDNKAEPEDLPVAPWY